MHVILIGGQARRAGGLRDPGILCHHGTEREAQHCGEDEP